MEPSEAINVLEVVLRTLIKSVLGDEWATKGGLDAAKLEELRVEERKSRKGAVVSDDLLAFTHLYQLRQVIERNWQPFSLALGEKKQFSVYMDRIEDFRNAICQVK